MRKKIIAGNWKMNNDISATISLITELKKGITENTKATVIVCPPFTSLETTQTLLKDSIIKFGAQNMYYEDSGAFTGEISPLMLKSVGCEYVILGHSERRTIFQESDSLINKKIKTAIKHELKPIFCIGETLEQREKGITFEVCERQVKNGLEGISESELSHLIIAYEPVWAIGTGKTATSEQAEEVHSFVRKLIEKMYSKNLAEKIVIQYGGSVKPENAKELLSQPNIDGALVGGACLKADSFLKIIDAAN
ncbi:MAG: triose-phosphate isomerase [Stygiobacter sp.]|jgi:triosephosphate isomerase|uniref:Triosephosphate isomerase n=1 Tax=Stygiobacter electus TaxID=3032292 RepID=A0AAE3NY67_9BACT|nr:triose-phosphate isomerase [Stygiobacter electus]MDF1610759.1 triose-phosphate isomerase [Stygiobacter electus]